MSALEWMVRKIICQRFNEDNLKWFHSKITRHRNCYSGYTKIFQREEELMYYRVKVWLTTIVIKQLPDLALTLVNCQITSYNMTHKIYVTVLHQCCWSDHSGYNFIHSLKTINLFFNRLICHLSSNPLNCSDFYEIIFLCTLGYS